MACRRLEGCCAEDSKQPVQEVMLGRDALAVVLHGVQGTEVSRGCAPLVLVATRGYVVVSLQVLAVVGKMLLELAASCKGRGGGWRYGSQ